MSWAMGGGMYASRGRAVTPGYLLFDALVWDGTYLLPLHTYLGGSVFSSLSPHHYFLVNWPFWLVLLRFGSEEGEEVLMSGGRGGQPVLTSRGGRSVTWRRGCPIMAVFRVSSSIALLFRSLSRRLSRWIIMDRGWRCGNEGGTLCLVVKWGVKKIEGAGWELCKGLDKGMASKIVRVRG